MIQSGLGYFQNQIYSIVIYNLPSWIRDVFLADFIFSNHAPGPELAMICKAQIWSTSTVFSQNFVVISDTTVQAYSFTSITYFVMRTDISTLGSSVI